MDAVASKDARGQDLQPQRMSAESQCFVGIKTSEEGLFYVNVTPNPFNSQTKITIETCATGHYKAEIYNSIGQRVALLKDSYYDKGVHDLTWDGKGSGNSALQNGTYILHVEGVDKRGVGNRYNSKLYLGRY